MNLYDERGHLTERALTLSPEELTFDQLFERTEHITACSHCAERFALAALAEPEPEPVGLVSRTVAAIETERARAQNSRLGSFFTVAVAAVFAVTLFGSGVFTKVIDTAVQAPPQVVEAEKAERPDFRNGFIESFGKFASAVNGIHIGGNRDDS